MGRYVQLEVRKSDTVMAPQSTDYLCGTHYVIVSRHTIYRREDSLDSRIPWSYQPLNRENRASRLAWAQEHVI